MAVVTRQRFGVRPRSGALDRVLAQGDWQRAPTETDLVSRLSKAVLRPAVQNRRQRDQKISVTFCPGRLRTE